MFSTVNYNADEMGVEVPKVENLNDGQALEMITATERLTVNEKNVLVRDKIENHLNLLVKHEIN